MKTWQKQAKLRYSHDAKALMNALGKIDIAELEEFIQNNFYIVGDGYILQYLCYKEAIKREKKHASK